MCNLALCAWKNYLCVVAQPPKVSDGTRVARQHHGCDVHLLVPYDHKRSEKLDVLHRTLGRKRQTVVDCTAKLETGMPLTFFTEVTRVQLKLAGFVRKRIEMAQYQQSEGADTTRAPHNNVLLPETVMKIFYCPFIFPEAFLTFN